MLSLVTFLNLSPGMTAFLSVTIYLGLALLIGWWNQSRGNKFSYGFLFSLIFTFVGGFLIVALTDKGKSAKKSKKRRK